MNTKNIIFADVINSYQDSEWFLPLANYYKKRGVRVTVLLPIQECSHSQKMLANWIREYSDEVIYGADLVYGKKISPILKCNTCFCAVNKILNRIFLNRRVVFRGMFKAISRMLVNLTYIDAYYIPSDVYGNRKNNILLDVLCMHASNNNKPILGYVNKGISIQDKYNQNIGLTCLFTIRPFKHNKEDLNTVVMGAQRLTGHWLTEVNRYFSNAIEGNELSMQLTTNKPIVLLLLKTYTSVLSEFIEYDNYLLYRKQLIIKLLEEGFFLLIKPHPAQNKKELKSVSDILVKNDGDSAITYLPVQFVASKASCVVIEMASNSVLDCIAMNKKVYWPYYDIMKIEQQTRLRNTKRLIDEGSPELFFRFVENRFPTTDDSFEIKSHIVYEFNKLENIEINIGDSITECEEIISNMDISKSYSK